MGWLVRRVVSPVAELTVTIFVLSPMHPANAADWERLLFRFHLTKMLIMMAIIMMIGNIWQMLSLALV